MAGDLTALDAGVRLAGAIHVGLLGAYAVGTLRPWRLATIPTLYCFSLMAALLRPVAGADMGGSLGTLAWSLGSALPAATYLLVVQLSDRALPARCHVYVLAAPTLAIPLIHLAVAAGERAACVPAPGGACVPISPAMTVYEIVTGAGVLLLLMAVRGRGVAALRRDGDNRARAVLILTIVALHGLMLALSLGQLAGTVAAPRAMLAGAVLQVTMIYLVGTALFRLPVRETVPAETGTPAARAVPALEAGDAELLQRIERLMTVDKLYQEPGFSRRQLADELGVPEHRVTRAVNAGLGQSFTEMVNGYRVAEAEGLLARDGISVTEIAFAVGFNSLATFNRVFKQATGTNPSGYRRARVKATRVELAAPST